MESIEILDQPFESVPFELAALAHAQNYQRWVFDTVQPYLGDRILEIGAGIGNMSKWLPARDRLLLTESEPSLIDLLEKSVAGPEVPDPKTTVQRFNFMSDDIEPYCRENLDTILSFNVLEHVEDDRLALERLCHILKASSAPKPRRLITFVPAHSWAYGTMDQGFGHHRRYSYSSFSKLCAAVAPEAKIQGHYFNLFGLLGWFINGRILRRHSIGVSAIHTFEKICPLIRSIDDFLHKILRIKLGQSLLVVLTWE